MKEPLDAGCRTYAVTYRNAEVLVLENAQIRLAVLPEYGATAIEYLYKPMDLNLIWRAPMWKENLRRKRYLLYSEDAVYDSYPGGWFDIFPSIGKSPEGQEPHYLQHGEIMYLPWEYRVETETPEEIRVSMWTVLSRQAVRFTKTFEIRRDSTAVACTLTAENFGPVDVPYHWGIHPSVGKPFLSEACELRLSGENLGHFPKEGACIHEFPTRANLKEGSCEIRNGQLGLAFCMDWDVKDFPNALIWICANYSYGHFSHLGGYVTCILPRDTLLDGVEPETARILKPQSSVRNGYRLSIQTITKEVTE